MRHDVAKLWKLISPMTCVLGLAALAGVIGAKPAVGEQPSAAPVPLVGYEAPVQYGYGPYAPVAYGYQAYPYGYGYGHYSSWYGYGTEAAAQDDSAVTAVAYAPTPAAAEAAPAVAPPPPAYPYAAPYPYSGPYVDGGPLGYGHYGCGGSPGCGECKPRCSLLGFLRGLFCCKHRNKCGNDCGSYGYGYGHGGYGPDCHCNN